MRAFFRALRGGACGLTVLGAVAGTAVLAGNMADTFNFAAMDTVAAPEAARIKFAGFADSRINPEDRQAAVDKLQQVVDILGTTPTGRALMAQSVEARIGVVFDRSWLRSEMANGYYEDLRLLISLDDKLDVLTLLLTTAHELRHGTQFRLAGYRPALSNSLVRANGLGNAIEADARAFEAIVALEYALILRGQGKSPDAVVRALDYKEGEYVVAALIKTGSLETLTDDTRRELAAQIFEIYYSRFGDREYYEGKRADRVARAHDARFTFLAPDAADTDNIRQVARIGGVSYLPAAFDLAAPRYSGYGPAAYEKIAAIIGPHKIAGKLMEYQQAPGQHLQPWTVRACLRDLAYHTPMEPKDRLFCGIYLHDPGMMRTAMAQGGRLIDDYLSLTAGDLFHAFHSDADPKTRAEITGLILAEADKSANPGVVLRDFKKLVSDEISRQTVDDPAFQDIAIYVMTRHLEREGKPLLHAFPKQEGVTIADETTESGRTREGAVATWDALYARIRERIARPQTAAEVRLANLAAAMPPGTLSFRYELWAPAQGSELDKLRRSVASSAPRG